jgi:hypothetical protein
MAESEDQRLRDIIDSVMALNEANYDPINGETARGAWDKIGELRERIRELRAMLI